MGNLLDGAYLVTSLVFSRMASMPNDYTNGRPSTFPPAILDLSATNLKTECQTKRSKCVVNLLGGPSLAQQTRPPKSTRSLR